MIVTQILAFIVNYMAFLWDGARYAITGSRVTTVNGGNALLIVESPTVRLRFIRDQGQLFLDLQPTADTTETWFSVDLVRQLFLGRPEESAVLNEEYATFLRERLADIEERFSPDVWPSTQGEFEQLKVWRAKKLFG